MSKKSYTEGRAKRQAEEQYLPLGLRADIVLNARGRNRNTEKRRGKRKGGKPWSLAQCHTERRYSVNNT
jgi:hypothetical protein